MISESRRPSAPAFWVFAAVIAFLTATSARAGAARNYVWIEAEEYVSCSPELSVSPAPATSGGKTLGGQGIAAGEVPDGGYTVKYRFDIADAGAYDFWLRIGFNEARPPVEWRVDGGEWRRMSPEDWVTNLMQIYEFNTIGWDRGESVELSAGEHELELRCTEATGKRFLLRLDAMCFVKGRWVPETYLKPGETYDEAADREAREKVYELPAGKASEARPSVELSGPWQIARYDDPDMDEAPYEPIRALPEPEEYPLRWMGIEAPGNYFEAREEVALAHRVFYRTRVRVPREFDGRGFKLHFAGTNWIVSVFVNGRFVGDHTSVLVPWDLDVSRHIKPGQVNRITIGVKSSWYGFDTEKVGQPLKVLRDRPTSGQHFRYLWWVDAIYHSSKGEGQGLNNGLWNPVSLVATGPVYTSDVFVRTSVEKKRLEADVEVTNPTGSDTALSVRCEAVDDKTGGVAASFGPVKVSAPAGEKATVTVAGDWPDPKLWWPERDAQCYRLRTILMNDGEAIDTQEELFGFREITREGRHLLLNGIRWHFWNWHTGGAETIEEWLQEYEAANNRFHRFTSGDRKLFGYREKSLEKFDRLGIPGRLSTCIDGMVSTHDHYNPLVWKNFQRNVRQTVRAYRNHPSVVMWSLGNEIMLVEARLYFKKDYRRWEEEAAKLSQIAAELDPTRPSFQDGGGDLGGLIEMHNPHYAWGSLEKFPQDWYSYPTGPPVMPRPVKDRGLLYRWSGDKPYIHGEVFYYTASNKMAWFGGPRVYRSRADQDESAGRYGSIALEGARWQGITGICPWTRVLPHCAKSSEPRAVFVREQNSTFFGGADFERTIAVFNDGRKTDPLTLHWRIELDGDTVASGEKTYDVKPGHHEEDTISATLPDVEKRRDGRLVLELSAQGDAVFEDDKALSVLPHPPAPAGLGAGLLCAYDPRGAVIEWLKDRDVEFTSLDHLKGLPDAASTLLIGPYALTEANREMAAATLREFVSGGNTAIVLEQARPLAGAELPAAEIAVTDTKQKLEPGSSDFDPLAAVAQAQRSGAAGSIAHPVAPAHPVLEGLEASDFFTWSGSETCYMMPYETPSSSTINIIQAGEGLGQTPVLEIRLGRGSYLLSQMLVGQKLGVDPAADRMLYNALGWSARRAGAEPGVTTAYTAGDEALTAMLDSVSLDYSAAAELEECLDEANDVAVVRGTPSTVEWLAAHRGNVHSFCEGGGWLMLANVEPDALESFNRLVGVRHRMRSFGREKVSIRALTNELLMGLTDRDFDQRGAQILAPWMNLAAVSDRVFTTVVDGRDVASFGDLDGVDTRLADGLTRDEIFHYIRFFRFDDDTGEPLKFEGEEVRADFTYGRPETFTGMDISISKGPYSWLKDVLIVFDDNREDGIRVTMEERRGPQHVDFSPVRRASKVSIIALSRRSGESSKPTVAIDEVSLYRQLPGSFEQNAVLLTKPAGLAKYPVGDGGILLNQVDYTEQVTDDLDRKARARIAENVIKKKTIFANLLRNMGASVGRRSGRQSQ